MNNGVNNPKQQPPSIFVQILIFIGAILKSLTDIVIYPFKTSTVDPKTGSTVYFSFRRTIYGLAIVIIVLTIITIISYKQ